MKTRSSTPTGERRSDIQGLRCVAVVSVVAFHAGLAIPGGFVGVDVFLVISGFVITAMLMREWNSTGTLNMPRFYLRRFRRLTPALALVVITTMVGTSLLLSPFDRQGVAAETGIGAMLLVANAVIASVSGAYFDAPAESNPLLHTWSLSVEEQFYIVFPALLLLALTIGRRIGKQRSLALAVVTVVGLLSLAMIRGSVFGFPAGSWLLGFYSPLTRAWEFAAGAALALISGVLPWLRRGGIGLILGVLGSALLVASFWVIDGTTSFPGKATLLPVAGTSLLIAAGFSDNAVSRLLATRPMKLIGDLSYSIYLWHWPFIMFGLALWPVSPHAAVLAAAASLVPAVASYYLLEQPLRLMKPQSWALTLRFMTAVVLVPLLIAAGTSLAASRIWVPALESGRLSVAYPPAETESDVTVTSEDLGQPCAAEEIAGVINGNGLCLESGGDEPVTVALLGDSHAEHLFPGFVEQFPDDNVGLYSLRSPQFMGSPEGLDTTLGALTGMPHLEVVVISRMWDRPDLEAMRLPLRTAVERLVVAGVRVMVADDIPAYPFDVFSCQFRRAPALSGSRCTQPATRFESVRAAYLPMLEDAVLGQTNSMILPTSEPFCTKQQCSMAQDGKVVYGDRDHLNADGARWLVAGLAEDVPGFADAIRGDLADQS